MVLEELKETCIDNGVDQLCLQLQDFLRQHFGSGISYDYVFFNMHITLKNVRPVLPSSSNNM